MPQRIVQPPPPPTPSKEYYSVPDFTWFITYWSGPSSK